MKWEAYDPAWLVALVREQCPDEPWLADAAATCTRCQVESRAYIYFVDGASPNQPRSPWQFERNIVLSSPSEGEIVLDILTDQRIGGVEFVRRIQGSG